MKTSLLLVLIAWPMLGVTITDTLQLIDGSNANGRMVIALTTGTHASATTYAASRRVVTVTNGAVSVNLPANSTLTPAGTLYRVEYYLRDGGGTWTEYWNVPTGGPFTIRDVRWRPRSPTGYEAVFSGTTWSLPASIHGIRTSSMTVDCFDLSGNEIDCAVTVAPNTYDVTARFATTQAGRLVLNAYSEHRFATSRLQAECYDGSGNLVTCDVSVNSSTYAVVVDFATSQSGYVVVSAR
jgi:hypothetical protein